MSAVEPRRLLAVPCSMDPHRITSRIVRALVALALVGGTGAVAADGSGSAPACAAPLPPARMFYTLIDGGRERGDAVAELAPEADGRWRYEVVSRGRVGLLTITSTERSLFEWVDGTPRPLEFRRETKAGPFGREARASFDWDRMVATGEYRGDAWETPLEAGMLDRLLLQLASARLLAAGADAIHLTYLDRGRVRQLDDPELDRESVRAAGIDDARPAVRVDRVRGSRVTSTWHGLDAALLPVRMEHDDPDDDEHWTLEQDRIEWLPCPAAGVTLADQASG